MNGIRNKTGEELLFGMTRAAVRKLLGDPMDSFWRGMEYGYAPADNYGARLDGKLAVCYRENPKQKYNRKIGTVDWVPKDNDPVCGFKFRGNSKLYLEELRLLKQYPAEVLLVLAQLGYQQDQVSNNAHYLYSNERAYIYLDLGVSFHVGGKLVVEADVFDAAYWQDRGVMRKKKIKLAKPAMPRPKTRKGPVKTIVSDQTKGKCEVPAIRILTHSVEDDQIPIGQSKIGGSPDFPPSMEWPEPWSFLAQINCQEIRKLDKDKVLPTKGLLYFFITDDIAYGDGLVVHSNNTRKLSRVEPSEDVERIYDPCALEFALVDESGFATGFLEEGPGEFCFIKMLGHPVDQQEVRAEFNYKKEVLLFQMVNDENAAFDWGDGCAFYFIKRKHLAEMRFDKIWTDLYGQGLRITNRLYSSRPVDFVKGSAL